MGENDSGPSEKSSTNPLYGAAPPATQSSPAAYPESGTKASTMGSSNPLYGAVPDPNPATSSSNVAPSGGSSLMNRQKLDHDPPIIPTRPSRPPRPRSPTSIPAFLRRLTWILSLTLGVSSSIALVFSALILPRLHASYSARKALLDQQSTRLQKLVETLRLIHSQRIYGAVPPLQAEPSVTESRTGELPHSPKEKEKGAALEEIPSSASSTISTAAELHPATQGVGISLFAPTAPLFASLSTLASTRENTSTTRTSLLSTLESYTGALHRALWSPKPGHGGYAIGMNSLSANLAKERYGTGFSDGGQYGTKADGLEAVGISSRGEEYDAVRREIRGIKGMLLNRRNFTPLSTQAG